MSHFTKVMLSAASGVSGSSAESPYGSFYLYGTYSSGSLSESMHKVAPLHIPTTDTMLVALTHYQVNGGANTVVSDVVAVNKDTNAQTALFVSDHTDNSNVPAVVGDWFADVENNGDYYIAFAMCGNLDSQIKSTVQFSSNNNNFRPGCVLVKYNSSHVQQWKRAIYDDAVSGVARTQGYFPFFYFKGNDLFVVLSTYSSGSYSNNQGYMFGRIDKSDGTVDGATSHVSDSISRRASMEGFVTNRVYNPTDDKLYLGGYHVSSTSDMWMEKFTPSTTTGGVVNDYRKSYDVTINSVNYDHSFVVDDTHIWSCSLSGGSFTIRQRLKSDFSWVSGYQVNFTDTNISSSSNVNYTQIIQHPTNSDYLIGSCMVYATSGYYRYGVIFKFNKTTKSASIIDSHRSQSLSPSTLSMSGLVADDTSVQVGWWFNNGQHVLYHLDIDDIENETLGTSTTGLSNWYNRRANTTVATSSISSETTANETVLTMSSGNQNDFKSISDSYSGLQFLSGNSIYSSNRSYE